jgi:hypothetical protein
MIGGEMDIWIDKISSLIILKNRQKICKRPD